MANATSGHGAWRRPVKKVELSLPRPAKYDTPISKAKYATITIITIIGCDTIISLRIIDCVSSLFVQQVWAALSLEACYITGPRCLDFVGALAVFNHLADIAAANE